jgi:hypothetical protein
MNANVKFGLAWGIVGIVFYLAIRQMVAADVEVIIADHQLEAARVVVVFSIFLMYAYLVAGWSGWKACSYARKLDEAEAKLEMFDIANIHLPVDDTGPLSTVN